MSEDRSSTEEKTKDTQTLPVWEPSSELIAMMEKLSSQQRAALPRVAMARISDDHGTMAALFKGDDKICNKVNYYKKPNGWNHQAKWNAALLRYIVEYTPFYLSNVVRVVEDRIRLASAKAASRMIWLIDSPFGDIAIRASKDVLDRAGIGKAIEDDGNVTVVINGAEWKPNN